MDLCRAIDNHCGCPKRWLIFSFLNYYFHLIIQFYIIFLETTHNIYSNCSSPFFTSSPRVHGRTTSSTPHRIPPSPSHSTPRSPPPFHFRSSSIPPTISATTPTPPRKISKIYLTPTISLSLSPSPSRPLQSPIPPRRCRRHRHRSPSPRAAVPASCRILSGERPYAHPLSLCVSTWLSSARIAHLLDPPAFAKFVPQFLLRIGRSRSRVGAAFAQSRGPRFWAVFGLGGISPVLFPSANSRCSISKTTGGDEIFSPRTDCSFHCWGYWC